MQNSKARRLKTLEPLSGFVKAVSLLVAICLSSFVPSAPSFCETLSKEKPPLVSAQWPGALVDGDETIAKVLEAISGNLPKEDIRVLLRGVSSIERGAENFILQRADGQSLQLTREMKPGLHLFNFLEQTEKDAALKLGPEAAKFVHNVSALSAHDNGIALKHTGEQYCRIALARDQSILPIQLNELRLGTISCHVNNNYSPPKLYGVDGVEAVVLVGCLPVCVRPREFCRLQDSRGNTHLNFGIDSLVPAPLRLITGLPNLMHFSFTIKKRDSALPKTPLQAS